MYRYIIGKRDISVFRREWSDQRDSLLKKRHSRIIRDVWLPYACVLLETERSQKHFYVLLLRPKLLHWEVRASASLTPPSVKTLFADMGS